MIQRPRISAVAFAASFALAGLASADAQAGQPGDPSNAVAANDARWEIPGEFVVDFRDDTEPSAIRSLLTSLKMRFRGTALEEQTRIEIASVAPAEAARVLTRLRSDSRIEYVEPHFRVRAQFVPDDPMYKQQWHMKKDGAESAWNFSVGRGVTVAVVDTGVACETFEDFTKATDLADTRCVGGFNFVNKTPHANDDHGHGTHVAGTIAQSTNNALGVAGLAFRARLMPVKVLSGDGWGTTSAVADGIRWAADHGAQVINLSLGGPRNSRVLQNAVDYARKRRSLVVAAAGNSGGAVGYPAASRNVVGVSATNADDQLAPFSSRGRGVDIAAPGVGVLQQTVCESGRNKCEVFPSYNGTSMASPHVAGAAAMLVSMGVNRPEALEHALFAGARALPNDDKGHRYGAGRLDVGATARSVHTRQVAARLAALLVAAAFAFRWAKRKGLAVKPSSLRFWIAALASGVGLFAFAPWLVSRQLLAVDLLSRPIADWDLMVGASVHQFLPLANVLFPLGAAAVLLRLKGAKPWLAGLAVGTAGYLAATLLLGHHTSPLGWALTLVWCGLNALACVYVGALLIARER
jgi:serine protease